MASLFRRPGLVCQCQRTFSTSASRPVGLQWEKNNPEALAEVLPPYPYGPTRWYKQSRKGLYGGQKLMSGNNVGQDSEVKTRRTWRPNIFTRKLFSKALNRYVQVRVSTRVLRTIDKHGGLDEYLLGEKAMRIKELGESGWWLRWAITQTPAVRKRFAEERRLLGLPEEASELDATVEVLAEGEEVSLESAETLTTDDAFTVEQSEQLPPLKFRVGRGQHIMLTADGWRRTRPDPTRRTKIEVEQLKEKLFPDFVERRLQAYERELERLADTDGKPIEIDLARKTRLLKSARTEFNAELQRLAEETYAKRVEAKNEGKIFRQDERELKKEAERQAEAERHVLKA